MMNAPSKNINEIESENLAQQAGPTSLSIDFEKAKEFSKEELRSLISSLEEAMKTGEQLDVPVQHYFSFGVYGREMTVPAGTLIVGKIHKFQNFNIISKGEVSIISIDGIIRVNAPYSFVSQAGAKRVIYAHTDVVWTTILGTEEKDPEKIEEEFIAKNYEDLDAIEEKEKAWLS